jgi:hypothetical protein
LSNDVDPGTPCSHTHIPRQHGTYVVSNFRSLMQEREGLKRDAGPGIGIIRLGGFRPADLLGGHLNRVNTITVPAGGGGWGLHLGEGGTFRPVL